MILTDRQGRRDPIVQGHVAQGIERTGRQEQNAVMARLGPMGNVVRLGALIGAAMLCLVSAQVPAQRWHKS